MTKFCWGHATSLVICLILSWALLPLAGCNSTAVPTGTVAGKVTLGDEPYTGAAVVFFNTETGQGGTANIQSDGTFKIGEPIPTGKYVVYLALEISEPEPTNPGGSEVEGSVSMTPDEDVPAKYWNEADSDIIHEITEGSNNVTVELKKEG